MHVLVCALSSGQTRGESEECIDYTVFYQSVRSMEGREMGAAWERGRKRRRRKEGREGGGRKGGSERENEKEDERNIEANMRM